jgi:hypothetical protein
MNLGLCNVAEDASSLRASMTESIVETYLEFIEESQSQVSDTPSDFFGRAPFAQHKACNTEAIDLKSQCWAVIALRFCTAKERIRQRRRRGRGDVLDRR